ncbi:efflux RND transporter periplasmic adaptor subunit [Inhella crocodyli]|uniref:Efflux RND transporter periplasmic adaptor subunit n=1 Tax=Inhella crocodyli TaxID=2499851 RepID=A0A437LL37_9BURK|nr:efflux RND transporter periplasmic adaptor subunit [Inhella crocodyli]RVT86031.1 efflux RND transporter periplasmic adaptor subunit [Inhella crocodyli]
MATDAPSTGLLKIQRGAASAPQRRRRWRWGLLTAVAVAIGGAVLKPKVPEVQTVSVAQTTPSVQYQQLTASGFVVAQRRAAVASKATGRLVELNVREGSRVQAGQLLARLDASDVQATLQVAQAAIGQAQALAAQGQALVRQAQVELSNAEAEFERTRQLREQGFVSPQALDAAQRRLDAARASVASAQAGAAQSQASVTQARAQLGVQQVNQGYTEIRAPFDGVVLAKNANVGDLITPFSNAAGSQGAVLTLADLSTLEVEADVSEGSLAKVTQGMPVEITLDALPGQRFRGQVASIVPTVDRAKATVMTKVKFETLSDRILPEMSAKVLFLSQRPTDAEQQPVLAVPAKALVDGTVWKLVTEGDRTRVQAVAVKAGRKLAEAVEVTPAAGAQLASGDRLVAAPQGLKDGQAVKVSAK